MPWRCRLRSDLPLPPLTGLRGVVVNWRDPWHRAAGGSERYAWELAQALRGAGADVEFLTGRDGGQSARSTVDGIVVTRLGSTFAFYLRCLVALTLRRRRTDFVVDVENGIPSFAPVVLRRSTPVLLVMHHVHLDQFGTHFPAPVAAVGRFLERRVMPRVYRRARTVAVSESTRDEMVRRLGWSGPVEIVHNGADGGLVLGHEPDPRRVVVLGRLVAHKRVDRVLVACADLMSAGRPVRLDVVGRGPETQALRDRATALGLADHVTFHGFVDEQRKAALLRRAQLHVCASQGEGWGQVVLEAAAAGVPTLAYDVPGLRDSVLDERTGWLLPAEADLTDGLDRALAALAEPGLPSLMADECRAWADKFTWSTMRARFVDLVHEETRR